MHALQVEPLPYNHHLHQFLTFLKHERGFADATIVNRRRSLKPFLAWVIAHDVQLSAVSPVTITKYFTSAIAGRWKRTSVSFHVQSLRSFFRYASSRGWCAAGIAESIDAPRLYTYENLPQGPSWGEVGKLLASVDGTSPVQTRVAARSCFAWSMAFAWAKSVGCVLKTSTNEVVESRAGAFL
jgi:site-specific recombinase XerD